MGFDDRYSPLPGSYLEGYVDEVTVAAGGRLHVMLSVDAHTEQPVRATARVGRLIHGDPNPAGPGRREKVVDWDVAPSVDVVRQVLDIGSYVEVPSAEALSPRGSFTLALWYQATLLTGNWQTLAAKWSSGELEYGIFVAGARTGFLAAALSHDGLTARWCAGLGEVKENVWQFVALAYDADQARLHVHQLVDRTRPVISTWRQLETGHLRPGRAPLTFGAISHPRKEVPRHWGHFNGKIARPTLLPIAVVQDDVVRLASGEVDVASASGFWDFSRDVSLMHVPDISPHQNNGLVVNAPARAVTGPAWSGSAIDLYTERPEEYDAIHVHDDDLDDARWAPSLAVDVPHDARSGIYNVAVTTDQDELFLPFVVTGSPRSPLAFLVPTLTWQAYSSNRAWWSQTEDGVLDRVPSLYDVHRDGSIVYYATRRKPTRSGNPFFVRPEAGAHIITADLYLVDWLEHEGFSYDVISDEDLHRRGIELLEDYTCVIAASHPEYWTWEMLQAARRYLFAGGRIAYLGGNGFYWVTSIDAHRAHLIEVRKVRDRDHRLHLVAPGENQHSTTLELGGLWETRGYPPRSTVGVDFAAAAYGRSGGAWGFVRLPASREPEFRFLFDGVDEEVIGAFGLNLGTAASLEMDAVREWDWPDGVRVVPLARATHPSFQAVALARPAAEIAFVEYPDGGAVFSAGSITWTGSLSHYAYENNVSWITANVLQRFLSAPRGSSVLD
jgi:N,N-dimethylformamidase